MAGYIVMKKFGIGGWFAFIISILLLLDLTILLDTPFLRQILGFLFLTILPGLLILQILKLDKLGFTEKFVLSVGLSISFLMFFGLLLNNLSLGLGYETPLATIPLFILFNLAFIVLAIVGYKINKDPLFSLPNLNLTAPEKAFLIVPVFFPALSIFGMHVMNTTDNNIILMLMLFLIPIYVVFVCFFTHKFPKRMYPVVIFLISISLLLLISLRSNHIIGADAHTEYYFFQTTLDNLHWSVFGHSVLDACLSISLLPAIYQSILNVNSEYLFKILYSLLFSISPLVIYVLSEKYVGAGYAFLASCFFMFQSRFLITSFGPRTSVAILFFALAMMMLFSDRIAPLKKRFLFIVFMASCIVSHYSTAYIFFFIILGVFVGMVILSRKYTIKKVVSLTIVVLFFAMIFFWYSQVTETAFDAGVGYIENTLTNLNKFFIEESRRENVQMLFGKGLEEKGIPYRIEFVFTWLTFGFIGIGILTLIRRYKEMSFPELNFKKPDFLKNKFEVTYFLIALACAALLAAFVALPWISKGYGIDRLYAVAITILSVFFVIGGITLSKHFFFFTKRKPVLKEKQKSSTKNTPQVRAYLVILLVLIPYFFCVTGVTSQMFGVRNAIILNSEGKQYDRMYIHDQESYGAKWLGDYAAERQRIYADFFGGRRLVSQGKITPSRIDHYWLPKHGKIDGYIYLRYQNVVNGELMDLHGEVYNMTDYQFDEKNEIYDSGCSKIYC